MDVNGELDEQVSSGEDKSAAGPKVNADEVLNMAVYYSPEAWLLSADDYTIFLSASRDDARQAAIKYVEGMLTAAGVTFDQSNKDFKPDDKDGK